MLNLRCFLFMSIAAWTLTCSSLVHAASITKCNAQTRRCIVRLEEGIVGDTVNVLNEKAQVVASGWIIKRKGEFGVVTFKHVLRNVKVGYPVIVNVQRRVDEVKWASAFGPTSALR